MLLLTDICASVGSFLLCRSRAVLQSRARNKESQQNGNRDDAEDDSHHAADMSDEDEAVWSMNQAHPSTAGSSVVAVPATKP